MISVGALFCLFFFALGAIVGSFINVVVLRMNTGVSFVRGRSRCFSCSRTLSGLELIPILGFFIVRGKCRSCRAAISLQYPVVEFVSGVMFTLVALRVSFPVPFLFYAAAWSVLLAISVYDMRHKIIPGTLAYLLLALAASSLVMKVFEGQVFPALQYALAGIGLFLFFWALWFVSRGRWMGFGDAELAAGLGFMLGPGRAVTGTVFAFWIGAGVGLGLILFNKLFLRRKSLTLKSEIPFAPFLALGAFLAFLFDVSFF